MAPTLRIGRTWLLVTLTAVATAGCGRAQPEPPAVKVTAAADKPLPPCCAPQTQPVAQTAPATQPAVLTIAAPSHASPWTEPGKRLQFNLDFGVTDQAGRHGRLSQYLGKPMAVSFIFTRCSNPQMCPLIAQVTGFLQRDLAKAGLGDKVRLLLISYDPDYDTPARLKQFALDHDIRFDDGLVTMLRPDPDDYVALMTELSIDVRVSPEGQINHRAELLLIDRDGRFVRDYQGRVWDPSPVVADLTKLAQEPASIMSKKDVAGAPGL